MKRCILLLVDGLRADVAEAELAAGRLPQLAALSQAGARRRAVSVFPSTTSVAYLPFLTGCLPGRCNIPSIRWLDRSAYRGRWWRDRDAVRSYCGYQAGYLDRDITSDVKTLFQLVPDSAAIWSMINRGLDPARNLGQRGRTAWGVVSHFTKRFQAGDDAVARLLAETVNQPLRFVFAQFPGVDGHTHADRPDGPLALHSLHRVDALVGDLVARLEQRGELQDSLILAVSDHGAAVVHGHFDVACWLEARGVPTLRHPVLWRRHPRAAVMVAGNSAAAIYLHPGGGAGPRLSLDALRRPDTFGTGQDMVAALLAEPAVGLLAAENGAGGVRVASRDGEADLSRTDEGLVYTPDTGDPLDVGGAFRGTRSAYLAQTLGGRYPDAGVHLLDQFSSPRAGDLVLAATEGWDFRDQWEVPEHRSGHGSLIASHIMTPLWSNQPLADRPWRTADVFPTILDWLGVTVPSGVDGVSGLR